MRASLMPPRVKYGGKQIAHSKKNIGNGSAHAEENDRKASEEAGLKAW